MSGGLWVTGDVITADRMNKKTIHILTGNEIASLTITYPGMIVFCTESGSGFIAGYYYYRNALNTEWILLQKVPMNIVRVEPQVSEYVTPSNAIASSNTSYYEIDTGGTTISNGWSGVIRWVPFTPTQSFTTSKIKLYITTQAGYIRVALYNDNNGNPYSLLCQSDSVACGPANAWQSISIPFVNLTANTQYWVATQFSDGSTSIYCKSVTGLNRFKSYTYGPFPTTASWDGSGSWCPRSIIASAYGYTTNVIDDDLSTYWESLNEENPWLYIDVGALKHISAIRIYWLTEGRPNNYVISVSGDATTWEDVLSRDTQPLANTWSEYVFNTRYCRYIRIKAIGTLAMRIAEIDYAQKTLDYAFDTHGHEKLY